jgi:hypothetical protein
MQNAASFMMSFATWQCNPYNFRQLQTQTPTDFSVDGVGTTNAL